MRTVLINFVLLFPVYLSLPDVSILWQNRSDGLLKIVTNGANELANQCIERGLEVEYRFEFQLCKRRLAWFDTCKDPQKKVKRLSFDPISETYKVNSAATSISEEGTLTFKNKTEALSQASSVTDIPISLLAKDDERFIQSRRSYIAARLRSECLGKYNETLSSLAYYLTLGMIDSGVYDSGWDDYVLHEKAKPKRISLSGDQR